MEITDIKVYPVDEEKLKAFVTVVFDRCFVVCDIKVIHGNNGLFVSMPSKRRKDGTFRDVAHPLNSDTRRMIEEKILAAYERALADGVSSRRTRRPREAAEDDRARDDRGARPSAGADPGVQPEAGA